MTLSMEFHSSMVDFESFSLRPKSSFQDFIAQNHRHDIQRMRNCSGQPFFRADYEKVRIVGKGKLNIDYDLL